MKRNLKKAIAATLAMSMCVPALSFAADTTANVSGESNGKFTTSFDVYSPALHISVPLKMDVQVNPMADSTLSTVKKFTVASNSIDIINASVDTEEDSAIPVNITVNASVTKKDDVITEYNTFTPDNTSTKKKINLNLTAAKTAATLDITNAAADATNAKLTDLSKITIDDAAEYDTTAANANTTAITQYGSLISIDVDGPTTTEANNSFTADLTKVTPAVGSFAVTGVANTNADWKADDVAVSVTYNVKASKELSITTPKVATAPTFVAGTSAADVSIVVPNVGEATVTAMALHNDSEGAYGDVVWESDSYKVVYAPNTTASTQTDATITIPKDDAFLAVLAGEDYSAKAQDLVIQLSDGRHVITTLTATAAP